MDAFTQLPHHSKLDAVSTNNNWFHIHVLLMDVLLLSTFSTFFLSQTKVSRNRKAKHGLLVSYELQLPMPLV